MKVDFYVIEAASGQQSLLFACQMLEKMHEEQKRVYVHTRSREDAERLDALLWTYKDDSFLPHHIYDKAASFSPPIQIGSGEAPASHPETMLNLCPEIPAFYQQFSHIIEIVFADPPVQQLARVRFKQYRDLGCEMNTIKLNARELK